jgi:hypothetical protein
VDNDSTATKSANPIVPKRCIARSPKDRQQLLPMAYRCQ